MIDTLDHSGHARAVCWAGMSRLRVLMKVRLREVHWNARQQAVVVFRYAAITALLAGTMSGTTSAFVVAGQ